MSTQENGFAVIGQTGLIIDIGLDASELRYRWNVYPKDILGGLRKIVPIKYALVQQDETKENE